MRNLIGQDSQILCFIVIIITTDFFIIETGDEYDPPGYLNQLSPCFSFPSAVIIDT